MKLNLPMNIRLRRINPPSAVKTTTLLRERLLSLARIRKIDAAHLSRTFHSPLAWQTRLAPRTEAVRAQSGWKCCASDESAGTLIAR